MTVAQLRLFLATLPNDTQVLIDCDEDPVPAQDVDVIAHHVGNGGTPTLIIKAEL